MTTMAAVIREVATTYGVTADEILGKAQERRVAEPRQVAMYLCHRTVSGNEMKIARKFGRAHSTVRRSIEMIKTRRTSPVVDDVVTRLEQALATHPAFKPEETAHVR